MRVSALGVNMVVANTLEVANELLDKRSAIYSDRFFDMSRAQVT